MKECAEHAKNHSLREAQSAPIATSAKHDARAKTAEIRLRACHNAANVVPSNARQLGKLKMVG